MSNQFKRRSRGILQLSLAMLLTCSPCYALSIACLGNPDGLRVNLLREPRGIKRDIRFSWNVPVELPAAQTDYEIVVGKSPLLIDDPKAIIWRSGKIQSSSSFDVIPKGLKLDPGRHYFWSVRVWISDFRVSCWSEPQPIATDLSDGWGKARAIGAELPGHFLLRRSFTLEERPVVATMYAGGDERFKIWINGELVTAGPPRPIDGAFYSAVPIERYLSDQKTQVIAVQGYRESFIARLEILYSSGKREDLVSNKQWRALDVDAAYRTVLPGFQTGRLLPMSLDKNAVQIIDYYEHIDSPKYPLKWILPGFNDTAWEQASEKTSLSLTSTETEAIVSRQVIPLKIFSDEDRVLYDSTKTVSGSVHVEAQVNDAVSYPLELRYGAELTKENEVKYQLLEFFRSPKEFREEWLLKPGENFLSHFGTRTFRYLELKAPSISTKLRDVKVAVQALEYPFNVESSRFETSSPVINSAWDLSKYSMQALTSDIYVDTPNRERIPYEGDTFLSQICHSAVDPDLALWRFSIRYFLAKKTPYTEWQLLLPSMLRNYFQESGDSSFVREAYPKIAERMREFGSYASKNFLIDPPTTDLVDWPESEREDFEFLPINTVINSYYYRALTDSALLAESIGENEDARLLRSIASRVRESINTLLWNSELGLYTDGFGSDHTSVHANFFPIAMGVTPPNPENLRELLEDLPEDEITGSPYAAYFLISSLFELGLEEKAIRLLEAKGQRSWYGMIHSQNATTLTEAWAPKFKDNMSWNHQWGCAPLIIARDRIVGLKPETPAFQRWSMRPSPGELRMFKALIPTLVGSFEFEYARLNEKRTSIKIVAPSNTVGSIDLRGFGEITALSVDDRDYETTTLMSHGGLISLPPGVTRLELKIKVPNGKIGP